MRHLPRSQAYAEAVANNMSDITSSSHKDEYHIEFDFMSKLLRVENALLPPATKKSSSKGEETSGDEEDFIRCPTVVKNDFAVDKGLFQRKLSKVRRKMEKSRFGNNKVVPMESINKSGDRNVSVTNKGQPQTSENADGLPVDENSDDDSDFVSSKYINICMHLTHSNCNFTFTIYCGMCRMMMTYQ